MQRAARRIGFGCAALIGVLTLLHALPLRAQVSAWTAPFPMILTAQRATAMMQAAERGLDFVPGEILVRFKEGVSADGQQHALMALRTRPRVSDLRWAGPVALF